MSPEKSLADTRILEESARITTALLAAEEQVDIVAHAERALQLEDIRAKLGYVAIARAETAELIDTRIQEKTPVITPESLNGVLPLTEASAETTQFSRQAISEILSHQNDRLIVITGPCSIHDPKATLRYAEEVRRWREQYGDDLEIVMRFYPEKPRSERDWKGFIYDPRLDESDDINQGIVATRILSSQITDMGVPLAMERLNALTPQYVNGLIAYDAIGARNTTDQKAREYGSGTSSPLGFKNTLEGGVGVATQAVGSANGAHTFLGMGINGMPNQVRTLGNDLAHIILRGGEAGSNYSAEHISAAKQILSSKGLLVSIVVDASHGNSGKVASKQIEAVLDISGQVASGETAICGVMIESNLVAGAQKLRNNDGTLKKAEELVYGQSITDECVGLDQTEDMLAVLSQAAQARHKVLASKTIEKSVPISG
jgi:3-deoxy-7-phosphoheptulonate synthase